MSSPIYQFISHSFPTWCPFVCSPCRCLYSCPAKRFIRTIYLDIHVNIQYLSFSFWLITSLCMTDSRSVHVSTNNRVLMGSYSTYSSVFNFFPTLWYLEIQPGCWIQCSSGFNVCTLCYLQPAVSSRSRWQHIAWQAASLLHRNPQVVSQRFSGQPPHCPSSLKPEWQNAYAVEAAVWFLKLWVRTGFTRNFCLSNTRLIKWEGGRQCIDTCCLRWPCRTF